MTTLLTHSDTMNANTKLTISISLHRTAARPRDEQQSFRQQGTQRKRMKVTVVGTGDVGLVSGGRVAEMGNHEV